MKYRNFDYNKTQETVINKTLNKLLVNNDLLIKKMVFDYLYENCFHCGTKLCNSLYKLNGDPVCIRCVNYYIYCAKNKCDKVVFKPKYKDRCKFCLSWYCCEHRKSKCFCQII